MVIKLHVAMKISTLLCFEKKKDYLLEKLAFDNTTVQMKQNQIQSLKLFSKNAAGCAAVQK